MATNNKSCYPYATHGYTQEESPSIAHNGTEIYNQIEFKPEKIQRNPIIPLSGIQT